MTSTMHLLTAVLLLVNAPATVRTQTATGSPSLQQPTGVPPLEPGKPIERELAGEQVHSYRIAVTSGQYLRVVVDQRGIDVAVNLFGPDGKKLMEVDSRKGAQGPEPVSMIVEATGDHRLEVRSLGKTAAAGLYEVKIEELRTATGQDKSRVAAEQAFMQAELLRGQGTAASRKSAIKKYEESLMLFRTLGDRGREATTLNVIGLSYSSLGEKQKALDFYNQALPLRRSVRDQRGEAVTIHNIGGVYDSLGEKQKALDFYNQSLTLFGALGDRSSEATTLNSIGFIYNALGEKQKALDSYNKSLPLRRAVGDRSGEAGTLNNIGAVYDSLGEKQKALDFYNQSLPLFHAVGDRNGEAATLSNIGFIYASLGERQKALDFYTQSLPLRRLVGDRSGEAITLNNIGRVYDSLGEKLKALDFYSQSLPLARAVGNRNGEAMTLNNIGTTYDSLGEKQKALDFFNQSLLLRRAVSDRSGEAITLNNIGKVYDSLGDRQKALDFYNQSLPIIRAVGNRGGEAITLANVAKVERDRGNLTEARARIEEALTIFESLRTKIASQELRASYFATVQKHYDFYIDLLMRLHKLRPTGGHDGEALQASERARARSLLETLAEANADIRQGVDAKLLERERALQQQLNTKAQQQTRLLSGRHTKEQADAIAKEIDALTSEFQQTEAQIRQTSPRYAALTQPQPLAVHEIQAQVLDTDTLLLQYALGDDKSYLWAVTPTSLSSYELPKREMIETAAKRVYELLNARNEFIKGETKSQQQARIAKDDVDYPAAAKQLSQMILAPVATQLGRKRLLIISDGALQFIPFAALPDPAPTRAGRAEPLVISHELVSLPSASTLAVLRREQKDRRPATKVLAVLADPVFAPDDERVIKLNERSATNSKPENGITLTTPAIGSKAALVNEARPTTESNASRQLVKEQLAKSAQESNVTDAELRIARLPGSRREATQIMALIPERQGKLALDFAASRATALSNDLSDYRYVHFATHGLLNSTHPELSGIVFSLVDSNGEPEDGFLRAHEVFNLKLSADLVVLSACQTGLGKEVRGEGLMSLTRGFMYAGAPRVVVSLWSVDDEATASLMVGFYKAMLSRKISPAAALRAAQMDIRKQKQRTNPYYWAAFTIQGEWR